MNNLQHTNHAITNHGNKERILFLFSFMGQNNLFRGLSHKFKIILFGEKTQSELPSLLMKGKVKRSFVALDFLSPVLY